MALIFNQPPNNSLPTYNNNNYLFSNTGHISGPQVHFNTHILYNGFDDKLACMLQITPILEGWLLPHFTVYI